MFEYFVARLTYFAINWKSAQQESKYHLRGDNFTGESRQRDDISMSMHYLNRISVHDVSYIQASNCTRICHNREHIVNLDGYLLALRSASLATFVPLVPEHELGRGKSCGMRHTSARVYVLTFVRNVGAFAAASRRRFSRA